MNIEFNAKENNLNGDIYIFIYIYICLLIDLLHEKHDLHIYTSYFVKILDRANRETDRALESFNQLFNLRKTY